MKKISNVKINKDILEGVENNLAKKIHYLLYLYEENGEWEKFLDSILIILMGMYDENNRTINFYVLFAKLSACRFLSYYYFRKNIFDCMQLLREV